MFIFSRKYAKYNKICSTEKQIFFNFVVKNIFFEMKDCLKIKRFKLGFLIRNLAIMFGFSNVD